MIGIYPRATRVFRPWKNGGGETAEILVSPENAGLDDFDWRISTAIVASDGPFSVFPGIDRVLTVIEGGGMQLSFGDRVQWLDADSSPLAFPGDVACSAKVGGGALLDFNVMTRRPLRAEVIRRPFVPPPDGALSRLVLLLEPAAGLDRLDVVDLDHCTPDLTHSMAGVQALTVQIWAD